MFALPVPTARAGQVSSPIGIGEHDPPVRVHFLANQLLCSEIIFSTPNKETTPPVTGCRPDHPRHNDDSMGQITLAILLMCNHSGSFLLAISKGEFFKKQVFRTKGGINACSIANPDH